MSDASEPNTVNGGPVHRRNRGVSKRAMITAGVLLVIFVGIGLAWYLWQRESNGSEEKIEPRISYSQEAKTELEQYQDDAAPGTEDQVKRSQFYLDRFYIKFDAEDYAGAVKDFDKATQHEQFNPGYAAYLVLSDAYERLGNATQRDEALSKADALAGKLENEELRNDALADVESRRGEI